MDRLTASWAPRYTCLNCGHRTRGWDRFKAHLAVCRQRTEEERRAWEEARRGD